MFLHANMATVHTALRTHSFTQRFLYTHAFYTETLWHTVAGAFTCKYLHGGVYFVRFLKYIRACSVTGMPLITHAFTQRYFYIEDTLHRDAFAQGCFHTQKCLFTHKHFYRQMILYWAIFHTDTRTNRGAVTKEWICTWGFYLRAFSRRHTIAWFPTADARMVQRVQQAYAKSQFHHRLWWSRRISWEKGGQHTHQHRNLTPMYDDRHVVRTGYVSWSSIHAALRSKRKVRNSQDWL